MGQSGLITPERQSEWDAWYVEHLRIMKTVSGIASAQRFKTNNKYWSPSLAMYTITSADVFHDTYYQRIHGMKECLPLIDKRFYIRNLFDGLDKALMVTSGTLLIVTDQQAPISEFHGIQFDWLRSVGLDRSTPFRGIALFDRFLPPQLLARPDVAVYTPC